MITRVEPALDGASGAGGRPAGAASSAADFDVDDRELLAAFEPFVTKRYDPGDPEWAGIVSQAARVQAAARRRRRLLGWVRHFRRTQRGIRAAYSLQWSQGRLEDQLTKRSSSVPFVFRGHTFRAASQGEKRVHHRLLFRAVERLAPRSVLEVGAGNGVNVLTLAARFPGLRVTALEVTRGGVEATSALRALPELPRFLGEFSVEPPRDLTAHRRVSIIQGSGGALPFADGAFDLVFTVLALEQMEEIRDSALAELRRVSRGHVLMIEPFKDWNGSSIRRDYVVSHDYFSASVADLPGFGLQPIYTDEIPAKLARGAGVVLARVV